MQEAANVIVEIFVWLVEYVSSVQLTPLISTVVFMCSYFLLRRGVLPSRRWLSIMSHRDICNVEVMSPTSLSYDNSAADTVLPLVI